MRDEELVTFMQWALPCLRLRWEGFRKVRRQVGKRLGRRLRELKLDTLDHYRNRLQDDPAEWGLLDELCHITISCLYRDKHVFDTLGSFVLPELGREADSQGRPVRCWCAGCARGEEVYTLKILWELDVRPKLPEGRIEIAGSDVDSTVLKRAEKGCFAPGSLKSIPGHWRDLAFSRDNWFYCVRAEYHDGLVFLRQDIRSEIPAGLFDLILCRNLALAYFDIDQQREIMGRIRAILRDRGYLVIGAHEHLPEGGPPFVQVCDCPAIFRKA